MKKRDKNRSSFAVSSRRLWLVDVENLCGKPCVGESDANAAKEYLERECGCQADDLVIVGTSHKSNLASAMFAWGRSANVVFKPGHDGADLVLIEAANFHVAHASTFEEVFVVSGDAIFTDTVKTFQEARSKVTVVSRSRSLGNRLSDAADVIKLVDGSIFD